MPLIVAISVMLGCELFTEPTPSEPPPCKIVQVATITRANGKIDTVAIVYQKTFYCVIPGHDSIIHIDLR